MDTNKFKKLFSVLGIIIFLITANFATLANSSPVSFRDGQWEASLLIKYIDSTKLEFDGGASANLNKEWGWGFGVGYNFTKNWAFNFDFSGTTVGYGGTRVLDTGNTEQVSGRLSTTSSNFSGIYHFTNKRFTPFIGASIGWIFIDSNIADGPPGSVCWYDPWWGYICSGYQPTKTTTEFTYGVNLGMRFEVNREMFLRGSVGRTWADISKTASTPELDNIKFDIGIMF